MSARVLLVDDVDLNLKVLEAMLANEYYQVFTARSGEEALVKAAAEAPDVILLDVMMPGVDGFEVCRRLKEDEETAHIPVVMVTALDGRADRLKALTLGADDFITKPVDAAQLIARIRSLARLKVVVDELRSRERSGRRIGVIEGEFLRDADLRARLLMVHDDAVEADRLRTVLAQEHAVVAMEETSAVPHGAPDAAVVSVAAQTFDGLKVVARLRSAEATRHLPIVAIADSKDRARALRALDLGASDIVYRPVDPDELSARVRTLIRRKRHMEAIREALDHSLELAVTDQLTGLHNRRYLLGQLNGLVMRAARGGDPVSVILADIDYFKRINDTWGHDAGDEVLKEFSARLASNFRPLDIAARIGGEEFVVVLPGLRGDAACLVAERLRRHVAGAGFAILGGRERITVTVSLGVAVAGAGDTAEKLLRRADAALYRAKQDGRNRVAAEAA